MGASVCNHTFAELLAVAATDRKLKKEGKEWLQQMFEG
jgi:hypothetical protein